MDERIVALTALLAVVGIFMIARSLSRSATRRRREWLRRLTSPLAARNVESNERCEQLAFRFGDRDFELSDAYRGGGIGAHTTAIRYVTVRTPLAGHAWELHSVTVKQRRRSGAFEERVRVEEFGLPMRDGWLSERVRSAIVALYDLPIPDGEILVEEGALSYRAMSRITKFEPAAFQALLERQSALADVLERQHH